MNATHAPATARYHTHVHALTRPDGTVTTRPEELEPTVVEAADEDTAAKLAAWAFIEAELPGRPVGWTLHVQVVGPCYADKPARGWTIDIHIDGVEQTLH